MKKFILTQVQSKLTSLVIEDGKVTDIHCDENGMHPLLGRIVIGVIKDVRKNIHALFVEIEEGLTCFMAMPEEGGMIFVNPKHDNNPHEGDLILCRVTQEAIKTKAPTVSCHIELVGRYAILSNKNPGAIGVSKKIKDKALADKLRHLAMPYADDTMGIVLRSDCETAYFFEIEEELKRESERFRQIYRNAFHRTAHSVLYEPEPLYVSDIFHAHLHEDDEIVTDIPAIYEDLLERALPARLRLYEDFYPLAKCYSLNSILQKALEKTAWCESGAYLVIEPTEALTVIDVNTGKFEGKNLSREESFLAIDCEAADEICRQLRLRNLSGMILVDLINLKKKEHIEQVIARLKKGLQNDPVHAQLVDITALGLVEITRARERRPLREMISLKELIDE